MPGDRTWFRNPHEPSTDASGFEGAWVVYLGGGLFNNFWKCDIVDEGKVEQLVRASMANADEVSRIVALMQRYREPRGVYTAAGGCLDTTREFARWVCPGTTDLMLPSL